MFSRSDDLGILSQGRARILSRIKILSHIEAFLLQLCSSILQNNGSPCRDSHLRTSASERTHVQLQVQPRWRPNTRVPAPPLQSLYCPLRATATAAADPPDLPAHRAAPAHPASSPRSCQGPNACSPGATCAWIPPHLFSSPQPAHSPTPYPTKC